MRFVFVAAVLVVSLLFGCAMKSSTPSSKIVGCWKTAGATLDIYDDNTYKLEGQYIFGRGTWKMINGTNDIAIRAANFPSLTHTNEDVTIKYIDTQHIVVSYDEYYYGTENYYQC